MANKCSGWMLQNAGKTMVHVENWKVAHAAWHMKCHEQAG